MTFKKPLSAHALLASLLLCGSVQAADIKGTVRYEGKVPKIRQLKMDADPICKGKHQKAPLAEYLILGEGNTMGNVFVRIKSGLSGKQYPAPTDPIVLTQEGCIYKPHVFGVMVGQPIKFLNPDGTLHNVHALPKKNRQFNVAMPANRTEAEKKFTKEEFMFPIKCDVHPWMKAWAGVMSHPYFDVTEKDGTFSLEKLEPGTYEIEAWHEKLGTLSETITVAAEDKSVDFTFTRTASKKPKNIKK